MAKDSESRFDPQRDCVCNAPWGDERLLNHSTWGLYWILLHSPEVLAQIKASLGRFFALHNLTRMLLEMRICSAARGLSKEGEIVSFLPWEFWKDVTLQEEAGCIRILKASDSDFARLAMDVFVLREQFNNHFRTKPVVVPSESNMIAMTPAATVVPCLDPDEAGIPYSWREIRRAVIKQWPTTIEGIPTSVIVRRLQTVGMLSEYGAHRSTVERALGRRPRK